MANIATCPKCAKQLALPAEFNTTDRAECPECRAIFSLSETVQISLPVVRVLSPDEQPTASVEVPAEVPAESPTARLDAPTLTGERCTPEALADNAAPLQSWEERLKKALALDGSDGAEVAKSEATDLDAQTPSKPPSFEFELETKPEVDTTPENQPTLNLELPNTFTSTQTSAPVEPESLAEVTPTKTLADFAASVTPSAEPSESLEPPAPTIEQPTTPTVEVAATPERRVATRRSSKVAAYVAGPMVGTVLGLYGLLWLQGPKADYLGLSYVLPASMLPADGDEDSPPVLAETKSPEDKPLVSNDLQEQDAKPLAPLKRDTEVKIVSASQPVVGRTSSGISAKEFRELVDDAAAAVPEFVAGDLSSSASIKQKGQAYMVLSRLAENFDFAKQPGLAPAVLEKAKQAAQLFGRVTYQAAARRDLAHIAARWWEYDQRPNNGIFLAGRVERTQPAGKGTLCWVKLSEQSTIGEVPVLLTHDRYQVGDQIGVVGKVLSDSADAPPEIHTGQEKIVAAEYDYALTAGP